MKFREILNKLNILIILLTIIRKLGEFSKRVDWISLDFYDFANDEINDLKTMFNNNTIKQFKNIVLMFKSSKYINYYYLYMNYINIFERFIRLDNPINLFDNLIDYLKISKILIIDSMKRKPQLNAHDLRNIDLILNNFHVSLIEFFEGYGGNLRDLINDFDFKLIDEEIENIEESENEFDEYDLNHMINELYYLKNDFIDDLKKLIDNRGVITTTEFNERFGELIDDLIDFVANRELIDLLESFKFGNKFILLQLN